MIRKIAAIPTQSLFQIEEIVHDKIDHKIMILAGKHVWQLNSKIDSVNDYLTVKTADGHKTVSLNFDRKKCESYFSLPKLVEECTELGAYDLFIDRMVLVLPMDRTIVSSPTLIYFNNAAPTVGSDIEKTVTAARKKFLRKHGYDLKELRLPRILEFTIARTLEGHPLDSSEVSTEKFLRWLSRETEGLVGSTDLEERERLVFRHGKFEAYNSIWREEIKEVEGGVRT